MSLWIELTSVITNCREIPILEYNFIHEVWNTRDTAIYNTGDNKNSHDCIQRIRVFCDYQVNIKWTIVISSGTL